VKMDCTCIFRYLYNTITIIPPFQSNPQIDPLRFCNAATPHVCRAIAALSQRHPRRTLRIQSFFFSPLEGAEMMGMCPRTLLPLLLFESVQYFLRESDMTTEISHGFCAMPPLLPQHTHKQTNRRQRNFVRFLHNLASLSGSM